MKKDKYSPEKHTINQILCFICICLFTIFIIVIYITDKNTFSHKLSDSQVCEKLQQELYENGNNVMTLIQKNILDNHTYLDTLNEEELKTVKRKILIFKSLDTRNRWSSLSSIKCSSVSTVFDFWTPELPAPVFLPIGSKYLLSTRVD